MESSYVQEFIISYKEALLWSSVVMTEEDETVSADEFDTAKETDSAMLDECLDFLTVASSDIEKAIEQYSYSWSQAGHDFALTRNGHGAGFWDRGLDTLGDILTAHAKDQGSAELYLGDDGLVYQM